MKTMFNYVVPNCPNIKKVYDLFPLNNLLHLEILIIDVTELSDEQIESIKTQNPKQRNEIINERFVKIIKKSPIDLFQYHQIYEEERNTDKLTHKYMVYCWFAIESFYRLYETLCDENFPNTTIPENGILKLLRNMILNLHNLITETINISKSNIIKNWINHIIETAMFYPMAVDFDSDYLTDKDYGNKDYIVSLDPVSSAGNAFLRNFTVSISKNIDELLFSKIDNERLQILVDNIYSIIINFNNIRNILLRETKKIILGVGERGSSKEDAFLWFKTNKSVSLFYLNGFKFKKEDDFKNGKRKKG